MVLGMQSFRCLRMRGCHQLLLPVVFRIFISLHSVDFNPYLNLIQVLQGPVSFTFILHTTASVFYLPILFLNPSMIPWLICRIFFALGVMKALLLANWSLQEGEEAKVSMMKARFSGVTGSTDLAFWTALFYFHLLG